MVGATHDLIFWPRPHPGPSPWPTSPHQLSLHVCMACQEQALFRNTWSLAPQIFQSHRSTEVQWLNPGAWRLVLRGPTPSLLTPLRVLALLQSELERHYFSAFLGIAWLGVLGKVSQPLWSPPPPITRIANMCPVLVTHQDRAQRLHLYQRSSCNRALISQLALLPRCDNRGTGRLH